jgi:hypothetical protein
MKYILLVLVCWSIADQTAASSTESNCNPSAGGQINIHLVPHSHDDVGWKETLEEYFSGPGIIQVKKIYDSVAKALLKDKSKTRR